MIGIKTDHVYENMDLNPAGWASGEHLCHGVDDVLQPARCGASIAEVGVRGGGVAAGGLDCCHMVARIGPAGSLENKARIYFFTSVVTS